MAKALQINSVMDLQDQLIESSKERRGKGAGKFSIASIALHGFMIAGILFMSATATHKVAAEKPIRAFLASNAATPPAGCLERAAFDADDQARADSEVVIRPANRNPEGAAEGGGADDVRDERRPI